MKVLLLLSLFSTTVLAGTPVLLPVEINKVYSPRGFDSNDSVEVVVSGWLPNACQTSPTFKVRKTNMNIEITLNALHYGESSPFCPPERVPFNQKIKLGVLSPGSYEIEINKDNTSSNFDRLKVVKAERQSVDSKRYPFITDVSVDESEQRVHLTGFRESGCYGLEDVDILSDGKNTYSVMPVLKKNRDFCPRKMQPVSVSFDIPASLNSKKVLLHIRSRSGDAFNRVITN